MQYKVILKSLPDGQWYARCDTTPSGVVEAQAHSREQVLQKVQNEIRYQLEYCPCSGISTGFLQLDVTEAASPR